jgi:hypothetical protein
MLSRGLRITFMVGIALIVVGLGLHVLLKFYNAPAAVEFDLLNVFAATFASTILTFFIGALLFDYQVERTEAKRKEQLRILLVTELTGIAEGLDLANAIKVRLSDGSAEVVVTHIQPTVIEEAIKGGFFSLSQAEGALRLAKNMRTYNAKVSYFLSLLSSGTIREPDSKQFVMRAIEEIEGTRQAIVADARKLADLR